MHKIAAVEEATYPIRAKGRCQLPGRTEGLICCVTEGLQEGREYMVEPVSQDDSLVSTPYGLIQGDREIFLRMANVGDQEVEFSPGQIVTVAQMWKVGTCSQGRSRTGSKRKAKERESPSGF